MSGSADPDREIARRLRLRAEPAPVVRLSRRSLALLSGVAAAAIAAVVGWSLTGHRHTGANPQPAESAIAPAPPAALVELPKDYAGLPPGTPRLGPPLPGDLGRPLLEARSGRDEPGAGASGASPSPAQEAARLARGSRLAVAVTARAPSPASTSPAPTPVAASGAAAPVRDDVSPARLEAPVSPYLLQAGSVIRAALVTGVRADLPGEVIAQVTEDVFDSVTGRWKLIPQGSRLIGSYDSHVAFGQSRVQLVWTRLILPDGRSLDLDKLPAADAQGYAGLEDQVDRHWSRLAGAALVSTTIGLGSELGSGAGEGQLVQALRTGVAASANQAGQQLVGKSLEAAPTLTVRPGAPVRVLVEKDLVLEPWS